MSSVRLDLEWQERGLCAQVDPELFFPEKGQSTKAAKQVCMACDVRGVCLEDALARGERFGIAGGKSERERRTIAAERAKQSPTTQEAEEAAA